MKYNYYIAYQHRTGYGNAEILRDDLIDDFNKIRNIAKELENPGIQEVSIDYIHLLKTIK